MTNDNQHRSLPLVPRPLPCFPCPYGSHCCNWGVSLLAEEVPIIRERYGDAALEWDDEESEWRTAVVRGACFFLANNACSIHDKPYYPKICRGFPWVDGETGGDYPYDRSICPEFPEFPESTEST